MFSRFYPDIFVKSFLDVTADFLTEKEIRGLLVDIDNTLVPWDTEKPTEAVLKWVNELKGAGVGICLISNNHEDRVKTFNEPLELPVIYDAKKPSKACYEKGYELLKLSKETVAVVGDQLFTDVWGGNRQGLYTILVEPVAVRDMRFVRFKRKLERIVFYFYKKRKENEN